MAQTIQIRRGTGSAVPSSLAAGELAINLDSGKLFYGKTSTSASSDFRVDSITAENYIVSSSVTSYTFQTFSGSTDFGNDSGDIHKRTGSLNISGALNVDGNLDVTGTTNLDAVDIDGNVQLDGTLTVGVDDTGYDVTLFGATADRKIVFDASQDHLKLYDNTKLVLGTGVHEVAFDASL